MPKLKCCVETCAYNEENSCCLGEIKVLGGDPAVPSTTCCENFIEKGDLANSVLETQESLYIVCDAIQCIHNKGCKCEAECVSIVGQSAHCSDETQCNTFCKC